MGWWQVAYWIATLILSEVLRPKVNIQNAKAASADEANMPTASSVKPVPVVWGKARLRDPNVTWYGDYFTVPIKKRAGKGGFLGTGRTQWQTVAYRYYWGQQLGLCHGPVTLHKVWSEERLVWSGTNTGGAFVIDDEGLYGGEDGGGGIAALLNFLPGDNTQVKDPYLTQMLTDVPAYRSVASLVWYGPSMNMASSYTLFGFVFPSQKQSGYIGTSPAPRPLTVEVSRYPQQLTPAEAIIGEDANPIEVVYECLTNDPNGPDGWGMGLSTAMVDTASFVAAAHQCYTEGFGISFVWSEQTPIEDVIKEVCKTIDATCFRDFRTGMWTIKLMRGGYNVATLPVLDVNNVIEVTNYSQMGLDGTTNEVKVNYSDRSQGYKGMPAQAQDLANMRLQGEVVSTTLSLKMITTAALADRVANRELLAQSTALSKAELIVNRSGYAFTPGDLFVLSWEPLGITSLVVRVMKSAIGLPNANRIRLSVVQDIFQLGQSSFMVGGGSQWTDPIPAPAAVTLQQAIELPYYYNQDQAQASHMVCATRPNTGCVTFEVWEKLNADTNFTYRDTCLGFTPTATLVNAYTSKPGVDAVGMVVNGSSELAALASYPPETVRTGVNLAVFATTGEIIAFESVVNNLDGTYTLTNVWGGLMDTVPGAHASGERIYFHSYGSSNPEDKTAQNATVNVKVLPFGPRGSVSLAGATQFNLTMVGRNTKPLPPGKIQANGIVQAAYILNDASVTWAHRNRLTEPAKYVVRQDDAGDPTAEGDYTVQVYVGGVLKRTTTAIMAGPYSYTPAMRTTDSSDGTLVTEIKVTQVASTISSTPNTTGPFIMNGLGMTLGQNLGGVQS